MKNLLIISVTAVLFLTTFTQPILGDHDHGNRHVEESNDQGLSCYSCVYVQSNPNMTNEGCEKQRPPEKYKRSDCFGFGNLQAAGAVRHTTNASHITHVGDTDAKNVHCVKISGFTSSGNLIVLRGCEGLYNTNETYHKEQCFKKPEYDFVFPGEGFVRDVEKCFCHGTGCNGSSGLISFLSLSLLIPVLTTLVSKI